MSAIHPSWMWMDRLQLRLKHLHLYSLLPGNYTYVCHVFGRWWWPAVALKNGIKIGAMWSRLDALCNVHFLTAAWCTTENYINEPQRPSKGQPRWMSGRMLWTRLHLAITAGTVEAERRALIGPVGRRLLCPWLDDYGLQGLKSAVFRKRVVWLSGFGTVCPHCVCVRVHMCVWLCVCTLLVSCACVYFCVEICVCASLGMCLCVRVCVCVFRKRRIQFNKIYGAFMTGRE